MANFVPLWYTASTSSTITEGQTQDFMIRVQKYVASSDLDTYTVLDNQYLEINFTLSHAGATFTNDDVVITAGESAGSLKPIETVDSNFNNTFGTFTVRLDAKLINLSTASFKNMYIVRVKMVDDGVWDGPESLTIKTNYARLNTFDTEGNVISVQTSGNLSASGSTISYAADREIWITPGTTVYGTTKSSIGSISYGAESRLFVQAFGMSRLYDPVIDSKGAYPNDTSSRVYIPAYNAIFNSAAYVPSSHITGRGTYLTPTRSDSYEESALNIYDEASGNILRSGLSFLFNGQLVQTLTYDSEPVDAYLRVQIIDAMTVWDEESDIFYEGKRFRAYQYWIAPSDVSGFDNTAVKPGHLYMLKDTTVYPYVVKTTTDNFGNKLLSFDADVWLDMGVYDAAVGASIIGTERIFRIVMNASEGEDLVITTEEDLGEIRVGEYCGHTVYPQIKATGDSLITFSLSKDSIHDITRYGLDLSADGFITGTCIAKSTEFDANDFIKLHFTVTANNRKGRLVSKDFELRIVRGFGEHFMSAYAVPSKNLERLWFETISTNVFSKMKYYRRSDPRFGLQRLPRILLKENYLDSTAPYVSMDDVKSKLRAGILVPDTIPEGKFKLSIGNYKVRSAIDNDGNAIYDVLYCELLPYGYTSAGSLDMFNYADNNTIVELFGIRENIKNAIGEDKYNIVLDPDDFKNRAVNTPGMDGVSTDMVDTLPRHMVHPSTDNGATAGLYFEIPVAYLEPGAGELLFTELAQANEHLKLLNTTIDVQAIQFLCYNHKSSNPKNVADSFNINL